MNTADIKAAAEKIQTAATDRKNAGHPTRRADEGVAALAQLVAVLADRLANVETQLAQKTRAAEHP